VLLGGTGCSDLDEFGTRPDQRYVGTVIGTEADDSCPEGRACSFIRRGFAVGTEMRMRFDPDEITARPGSISTTGGACAAPVFDETPLLPIAPLAHDPLSLYDFPGGGRIRSFIFVARPSDGPLSGRDAMIFVSLIRGGDVELRVIAGPGDDCAPEECEACDYFGVFRLRKRDVGDEG
jgi:hypothetical protein